MKTHVDADEFEQAVVRDRTRGAEVFAAECSLSRERWSAVYID